MGREETLSNIDKDPINWEIAHTAKNKIDRNQPFVRDEQQLFEQYKYLRWSIYRSLAPKFSDESTKNTLKSYIDEQFIRLCREYDIGSEVDFPGYVKALLNMRVRRVFMKRYYKDKNREPVVPPSTANYLAIGYNGETHLDDTNADVQVLLEQILQTVEFTEVDYVIIKELLRDTVTDGYIIKVIHQQFNIPDNEVKKRLRYIRKMFKQYMKENNLLP